MAGNMEDTMEGIIVFTARAEKGIVSYVCPHTGIRYRFTIEDATGVSRANVIYPGFSDLESQNLMQLSEGVGEEAGACALVVLSPEVGLSEDDDWVPSGRHYMQPAHPYTETVLGVLLKLRVRGEDGTMVDNRWVYQEESDGPPPYCYGGPSNPEDELVCVTLKLRVTEYGSRRTEFRVVYGVDE
ncbi:uncharacterized protein LOC127291228 [Leptopilina boulardi]|uniref:uncharacterized protein LOC127291228 n=1 Tax=Leptopilina boulardi TaxID=63433 RepID=UPI0021F68D63|nr:uncharacterized protein LOC127291228 [Leptopilina boulardi]